MGDFGTATYIANNREPHSAATATLGGPRDRGPYGIDVWTFGHIIFSCLTCLRAECLPEVLSKTPAQAGPVLDELHKVQVQCIPQ